MRHARRGTLILGVVVVLLCLTTAAAEPLPTPAARLRFFACAAVQFFGEGCSSADETTQPPFTSPVTTSAVPPSPSAPAPMASAPPTADTTSPDSTIPPNPLFTPETVSPETPPLLLRLLQAPTEANARAFLAWYQARLARIQQVQALLRAFSTPGTDTSAPLVGFNQAAPGHLEARPSIPLGHGREEKE